MYELHTAEVKFDNKITVIQNVFELFCCPDIKTNKFVNYEKVTCITNFQPTIAST